MAATDPSMQAAYRRALAKTGETVQIQRITGVAPTATIFSVSVNANVQDAMPDPRLLAESGYGASKIGAITQTRRKVIVMASDLAALSFPLPVQKGDKIVTADSGKLTVSDVDSHKRSIAGAIEIDAVAVQ